MAADADRARASRDGKCVRAGAGLDGLQRGVVAFEPALPDRATLESPDTIESGGELIYRVEKAIEQGCAAAAPIDRALVLIGQLHGFEER